MKIGASTLSGFKDDIGTNLEYFEELGLDYAEILHQYPNQDLDTSIFENYSLKYSVHSPIINLNIASLTENIRQASIAEIKKSIDLANEIDAEIVVVHRAGWADSRDRLRRRRCTCRPYSRDRQRG